MSEERRLAEEQGLWVPGWVERDTPVDALPGDEPPEDRNVGFNGLDGRDEVEVASEDEVLEVMQTEGRVLEPEIGLYERLASEEPPPLEASREIVAGGYADTYWTHFDFRSDVGKAIARIQKQFPWATFANTYYCHPPVYGRKYEFVSNDYFGGGMVNGRYVGYRGKPIGKDLGTRVFNAVFNDPHLPNIAWIIWWGRMWSRGYGWGPSPGGAVDSDAGHFYHVHVTYVL